MSEALSIPSGEAMEALGARLAHCLAGPVLVFLRGPLGAGKTTLVRGLLRARGHEGPVKSPTYTLVESYPGADWDIHHFDLYRLGDAGELEYMGIRDFLDGGAVGLVEWPERGAGVLPKADLELELAYAGEGREVTIRALSPEGERIAACLRQADKNGMGIAAFT